MIVTVVAGFLMMVGLIGVPIVPGLVLVVLATVLWAWQQADGRAWVVVGVATALYATGLITRYVARPTDASCRRGNPDPGGGGSDRHGRVLPRPGRRAPFGFELVTGFAIVLVWLLRLLTLGVSS